MRLMQWVKKLMHIVTNYDADLRDAHNRIDHLEKLVGIPKDRMKFHPKDWMLLDIMEEKTVPVPSETES